MSYREHPQAKTDDGRFVVASFDGNDGAFLHLMNPFPKDWTHEQIMEASHKAAMAARVVAPFHVPMKINHESGF